MNQIMGHTRVIGILLKQGFEDARGLHLVGVGLVGWQRCSIQYERIENLRLIVLRVARGDALHRPFERHSTRPVFDGLPILEKQT